MRYLPTMPRSSENIKHKRGSQPRGRRLLLGSLVTMVPNMEMATTISFPSKLNNLSNQISTATFDIKWKVIGIDNRASCCISRNRGDFLGTLTNYNITICGYAGYTKRNLEKAHCNGSGWTMQVGYTSSWYRTSYTIRRDITSSTHNIRWNIVVVKAQAAQQPLIMWPYFGATANTQRKSDYPETQM